MKSWCDCANFVTVRRRQSAGLAAPAGTSERPTLHPPARAHTQHILAVCVTAASRQPPASCRHPLPARTYRLFLLCVPGPGPTIPFSRFCNCVLLNCPLPAPDSHKLHSHQPSQPSTSSHCAAQHNTFDGAYFLNSNDGATRTFVNVQISS